METKIIFNGKQYASPEAMPEEVRQAYQDAPQFADADKNGIPDVLERGSSGNVIAIQQSSISFNGREFKSVGEMPAIVRRLFELAMGQADANRNGIPDALEAALSGRETPFPTAGTAGAETAARRTYPLPTRRTSANRSRQDLSEPQTRSISFSESS